MLQNSFCGAHSEKPFVRVSIRVPNGNLALPLSESLFLLIGVPLYVSAIFTWVVAS